MGGRQIELVREDTQCLEEAACDEDASNMCFAQWQEATDACGPYPPRPSRTSTQNAASSEPRASSTERAASAGERSHASVGAEEGRDVVDFRGREGPAGVAVGEHVDDRLVECLGPTVVHVGRPVGDASQARDL